MSQARKAGRKFLNESFDMSVHDILRDRLLAKAGLHEVKQPKYTLEQLEKVQWSREFERYMRNRLIMGGMRYGIFGQPGKPKYNSIESIEKRLAKYKETGNTELLVDIANLCMVEFVEGVHPNKHFSASDEQERIGVNES